MPGGPSRAKIGPRAASLGRNLKALQKPPDVVYNAKIMPSPTRADAFDAGRCYSRWEDEVRRSREEGWLSVRLPMRNSFSIYDFFRSLQLDVNQLRDMVIQERKPVRTPEGGAIFYGDPRARDVVDEAVNRAGLAI